MSENPMLDGVAFTVDDPPAQNRQKLVLLIGAALVVAVLAVKFLLLGGGDSTVASPPPVMTKKAAPAASGTPSPSAAAVVPAAFTDNVGADPFKPLVEPPPPSAAPAAPAPTLAPPPAQAPTVVVVNQPTPGPQTLTFKQIEADGSAHVTVDGAVYEVAKGQDFASRFKYTGPGTADPSCAGFVYGESSFTLCAGDSRTF